MTTQQHATWKAQAHQHWQENQPEKFKQLQKTGKLQQALTEAAEATASEMKTLTDSGLSQTEAWEMVREQHLFPPQEPQAEEAMEPDEGYNLMRDVNSALANLQTHGNEQ